jgi:hypothetical protein
MDKVALSVLEISGSGKETAGLKKNRYSISLGPLRFLEMALSVCFEASCRLGLSSMRLHAFAVLFFFA